MTKSIGTKMNDLESLTFIYNYNYNYKVTLFSKLFSEESCSVVGLSEQMSFQLGSELLATDVR